MHQLVEPYAAPSVPARPSCGDPVLPGLAWGVSALVSAVFPMWDLAAVPAAGLAVLLCCRARVSGVVERRRRRSAIVLAALAVPIAVATIGGYGELLRRMLPVLGDLVRTVARADL